LEKGLSQYNKDVHSAFRKGVKAWDAFIRPLTYAEKVPDHIIHVVAFIELHTG
jgi:hypothetical protein